MLSVALLEAALQDLWRGYHGANVETFVNTCEMEVGSKDNTRCWFDIRT
jgi:hypothetical protein